MNGRDEADREGRVTVNVGGIERISEVSSITCVINKIVINSTQIPLSGGQIQLTPGKTMTIKVYYTASAPGAGLLDSWHIGISARMGSQFGYDTTRHTGSGPISGSPEIGNLKGPSSNETLVIKWSGIAGSYSTPPPG